MKYIDNAFQFFIMSDYNFSLFGAIFGVFVVTYIASRLENTSINKYIDGLVLSFLFVLFIGYIGAFLWGQVYGIDTNFGIEILYKDSSVIPLQTPVFPLPIVYSIVYLILFSGMYTVSQMVTFPKGFVGHLGLILFSAIILIGEFFSGKYDVFTIAFNFHFTQILAIILIIYSGYNLYKIYKADGFDTKIMSVK